MLHTTTMTLNERELYKRIGTLIRERRQALGMSQIQLGKAIGMLRTSITNIEAGRQRVPIHVLYQLSQVLKIDAVALLPANAEVEQAESITVNIEGVTRDVSPKTAEFLRQELDEE